MPSACWRVSRRCSPGSCRTPTRRSAASSRNSTRSASSTTRSIMLISDNGASGEGGALGTFNEHRFTEHVPDTVEGNLAWSDELGGLRSYPHYSWGWAWAGNTPLRLWKRYTWLGGTRTPLVVHWPRGIDDGGAVRDQFVHAVDLMPTVLDAAGIDPPDAVDGVDAATGRRCVDPLHVLRLGRAVTAHVAVLRDARVAFDGRRRLEGDDRPRVEGRGRRRASDGGQSRRSPTTSGRCSVWPTTSPRPATSPPTIPTCSPTSRRGGSPRPSATRCSRSSTSSSVASPR